MAEPLQQLRPLELREAMAIGTIQPDHRRRHFAKMVAALAHHAMLLPVIGRDLAAEKGPIHCGICESALPLQSQPPLFARKPTADHLPLIVRFRTDSPLEISIRFFIVAGRFCILWS